MDLQYTPVWLGIVDEMIARGELPAWFMFSANATQTLSGFSRALDGELMPDGESTWDEEALTTFYETLLPRCVQGAGPLRFVGDSEIPFHLEPAAIWLDDMERYVAREMHDGFSFLHATLDGQRLDRTRSWI